AAAFFALDLDAALVLAHDLRAQEEPEAGPARRLLRREERLEEVRARGGGDPAAGVRHRDLDRALRGNAPGGDLDAAAGRRGVDRVGEEVEDDLLQLVRAAVDGRHAGLHAHLEREAGGGERRAHEVGG